MFNNMAAVGVNATSQIVTMDMKTLYSEAYKHIYIVWLYALAKQQGI